MRCYNWVVRDAAPLSQLTPKVAQYWGEDSEMLALFGAQASTPQYPLCHVTRDTRDPSGPNLFLHVDVYERCTGTGA